MNRRQFNAFLRCELCQQEWGIAHCLPYGRGIEGTQKLSPACEPVREAKQLFRRIHRGLEEDREHEKRGGTRKKPPRKDGVEKMEKTSRNEDNVYGKVTGKEGKNYEYEDAGSRRTDAEEP